MIVGTGEGEEADGGVGVVLPDSADDGMQGDTGGEYVIEEEDKRRLLDGREEGVAVHQFEVALIAGECFDLSGWAVLLQQGRLVAAAEAAGEGLTKEVEGRSLRRIGLGFYVMQGAEDKCMRREGEGAEQIKAAADPCFEIGTSAFFKFEEAMG